MPDYKLNIIGTFNNKQLVKALRKAGVDVHKLGKKTKDANKDMSKFRQTTAGMRRTLGAVRNNLLLVSFAFGTVGAAIGKSVKDFAKFEKVNIGFQELGKSVGFTSEALSKLKQATDGTVSSMELMKQANNAMLLGIVDSEDQMAELFDMAQRLASAVGQDAAFGIESLTTGIGRQSRLMLDNLGIIVRTEDAYKAYATQIKKNVSELTEQEKKTAIITAAMDSAREKVERLGYEQKTVSMILSETSATIGELSIALGKVFSPAVVATAKQITEWAESLRLLVFEYIILRGIELDDAEMLELIDSKNKELNATYEEWQYNLKNTTDWLGHQTDKTMMLGFVYIDLKEQIKRLTAEYLENLEVGESLAKNQEKISESIGQTKGHIEDMHPGMMLALDMYEKTKEAQADLIETQMALIVADSIMLEGQPNMEERLRRMGLAYDALAERLIKLTEVKEADELITRKQIDAVGKLAGSLAKLNESARGSALVTARLQQASIVASTASGMMAAISPPTGKPDLKGWLNFAAVAAAGLAQFATISRAMGDLKKAATGFEGIVDKPTMFLAGEAGPEHIGITPLSSPNLEGPQGGSNITLNISAPLLDESVVEHIIPAINEAVRRGETLATS